MLTEACKTPEDLKVIVKKVFKHFLAATLEDRRFYAQCVGVQRLKAGLPRLNLCPYS